MAQRLVTHVFDDLDGSLLDGESTVHFSVGGRRYEIDLSPENTVRFNDALAPYIAAGRQLRTLPKSRARQARNRN